MKEVKTQDLILSAALDEFHQNGFKGARTSRIAERAGISRTMLHYYFNTKEALFEAVLNKTFGAVLPHLTKMASGELFIFEFLEQLVEVISDMLEENPGLPSFVVNLMNENPQLILNITSFQDERTPDLVENLLAPARQMGKVRPDVRGEDLLINVWALCSTPYLLAPYIAAKEKRDSEAMRQFNRARRKTILEFIFHAIKVA